MQTLGRLGTGRRHAMRCLALALLVLASIGSTLASPPLAAAQEPISETITITGRGWGHGRGLSQWGAFGYATGRSGGPWDHRTILGHYYGDTQAGNISNPIGAVTLLGQRGKALAVERPAGVAIDGRDGTSGAVRAALRSDGRYDVQTAAACAGPWSQSLVLDGPVRLRAPGTTGASEDVLRLCRDDGTKVGYRGELVAMGRSFDGGDGGIAQTVNLVRLDDLIRSVLPGLLPPMWADIDDGRGRSALLAQAVASRGFAAVGDGRWRDLHSGFGAGFTTCDSSACQPYAGVGLEDERTDSVVRETTGEVRVRGTALVRTEFTASSGGWTAGITFPAVQDVGDLVPANPYRSWTELLGRDELESRYGLGRLQAIHIVERNGLGADGGRVLQIRLVGTAATQDLSGVEFRAAFGLPSDWFTVSGVPPRPPVEPRGIDQACPESEVPEARFTDVSEANVHARAVDCIAWWTLTTGRSAERFAPGGQVTRAQMASLVARLLEVTGVDLPDDPPDAFVDDNGIVHEPAIDALAAAGVVRGTSPGLYQPHTAVSREQAASLLARALEELAIVLKADAPDAFADDGGSVHERAINGLAAEGVLTGLSAGRLEPHDGTRRDQMASLLARTLDLVVERTSVTHP